MVQYFIYLFIFQKQIEALLVKECARVKKYAAQCEQYVDQNADRIIDLIMKDMTPKQICHELKVCSKGFIGVFPDSSSSSEENRDCKIHISYYNYLQKSYKIINCSGHR